MWRSGLIVGVVLFVFIFVTSVAMMACAPFELVFFGLLAGALSVHVEALTDPRKSAIRGAAAGGVAAVGGVFGSVAGQLIRFVFLFTPETITNMTDQLMGTANPEVIAQGASAFIMVSCVCLNIVVVPAMGALGGYLWCRFKNARTAGG